MAKLKSINVPKLILFGDSITQFSFQPNGWGAEMANKLVGMCDVVNRGMSGYNTRWAKVVLPHVIGSRNSEENHIAAVTVFFGANDASLEDKNPAQHIPLQEYSENLKEMVRILEVAGVSSRDVIFITPPPLQESAWEKECILKGCPLNRKNSITGQYAQACVEAAGQCSARVLDLWTLMQKDGQDYSVYLNDGLHLSERGNQFVAENLWEMLKNQWSHRPYTLPWRDVDPKDPESCLFGYLFR